MASEPFILYQEPLLLIPLGPLKIKKAKTKKKPLPPHQNKQTKNPPQTKTVANKRNIKTTGPVANTLVKYLQIKRNYKCSKLV